nr:fimbrillin family protein [uncultured Bacteroides sp.]
MLKLQSSLKAAVCMAAVALTAMSCSQDEWAEQSAPKGNTTIVASFEGADTRTSVNSNNQVVWNKDDAFGLFYTTQSKTTPTASKFTCSNADGTNTTAAFSGNLDTGAATSYAVYPYQESMSLSNNTVTMELPASFKYTTASEGPMYASASDITESISFKHLAGLLKLTVSSNIATKAKKFVITADKNIAGTCTADLETKPELAITSNEKASKTITVSLNFDKEQTTPTTFYIPILAGTYATLTAELQNEKGTPLFSAKEWKNVTVARADMLTSSFGFITIDATTPDDINDAIAKALPTEKPAEPVTTNVELSKAIDAASGSSTIAIPVVENSNVNLSLAALPTTTTLELKDENSTETDPTPAVNTVSIAIPKVENGVTAPSFTITMPKTTVVLDANSTDGTTTYGTVTAKTASNTLVINKGVTVTKLIAAGGNIRVAGIITNPLEKADGFRDDVLVIVEPEASVTIPETGFTKIDAAVYDMMQVAKNGGTYVLNSNVVLSKPLVIESTMTLDLNGHSITPKDGGLSQVLNTKDALILVRRGANLTINDSKGNAGRIDANNIESIYAAVKLTDSKDTGETLACLTVNGGTLNGYYYGIVGNGTRHGTEVTIKGGKIIGTKGSGIYHPQNGTLTVSGGDIEGNDTGIEMRSGTLKVTAGNIKATALTSDAKPNGSGTTITGAAVAVSQHVTDKDIKATLEGGTLEGIYALYEADLQNESSENITIDCSSNCTFNGKIYSRNCKAFIKSGTFSDPSALDYLADDADVNVSLNKDCETTKLYIPKGQTVVIDLNHKKLIVSGILEDDKITIGKAEYPNTNVLIGGNLTLKNGKFENNKLGMGLISNNAQLLLENIEYTTEASEHYGIFNDPYVKDSHIIVKNSTMSSVYYAINTNARVDKTTGKTGWTTMELENSTFTAKETALMVNTPSTITVNKCIFSGGWQGVLLRGGKATFTDSQIKLAFAGYATSSIVQGKTWGEGNNAPAAALTAGNRSTSAYDYKTEITLNNTTFSNDGTDGNEKNATEYPAIYIDTEGIDTKSNQGVELNYDEISKGSFEKAGKGLVIQKKEKDEDENKNVKINGIQQL